MPINPIALIDRLADKIVGSLHNLFGFQFSRNTEHFIYEDTVDTIVNYAVGNQLVGAFNFTQESDFVCTRLNTVTRYLINNTAADNGAMVGISTNAAVAGDWPDAPFTIRLQDGSTDRQLSNQEVDAFGAYGVMGGLPGVWSKPRLLSRNSTMSYGLTLLKAAANAADQLRIRTQLHGWKIYDSSALNLTSRRP